MSNQSKVWSPNKDSFLFRAKCNVSYGTINIDRSFILNEKTLEERMEEELKDQLTDISMLHTGNPEKTEAIKAFAVLYDKRQDTIKLKAEAEEAQAKKKDRVVDHIISGVGTVLPVLATGIMYAVGMNFEKTGTLTSTFFRNLVGKMKVTK